MQRLLSVHFSEISTLFSLQLVFPPFPGILNKAQKKRFRTPELQRKQHKRRTASLAISNFPPNAFKVPFHQKISYSPALAQRQLLWVRQPVHSLFSVSQEPSENQGLHIMEWGF